MKRRWVVCVCAYLYYQDDSQTAADASFVATNGIMFGFDDQNSCVNLYEQILNSTITYLARGKYTNIGCKDWQVTPLVLTSSLQASF